MFLEVDERGRVTRFNDEFEQFIFKNKNCKVGTFVYELLDLDRTKIKFLQKLIQLKRQAKSNVFSHKYDVAENFFWIEWTALSVQDNLVLIGKDITCIKNFEYLIKEQNQLLKDRNKNFIDSLKYSKRIQTALLPGKDRLSYFSDAFIIYKAKDIVSGDFYWFKETADKVFFASIDCTGHGVPGALMTVLANALLNELIIHEKKTGVSQILKEIDLRLKEALNTLESFINDGFDIALCCIDKKSKKMCFSGAFHNVFIVKSDEKYYYLKGNRRSIGGYYKEEYLFNTHEIVLSKGDRIYLSSDGFADQFGGAKNKKFGTKRLVEMLKELGDKRMSEQKVFLEDFYSFWKGTNEQIDDVLFIGFEV